MSLMALELGFEVIHASKGLSPYYLRVLRRHAAGRLRFRPES
jgi:hypothetical protein